MDPIVERIVHFPARTVLTVVAIVISVALVLDVIWLSRGVLAWVVIALFLTLALNPLVEWLLRHRIRSRGLAVALTFLCVAIVVAAIGATFIPTLIDQVNSFVNKIPTYVDNVTAGKGRFGFLETKYHVVEKVRDSIHGGGAKKLLGFSGTAVAVTKGVLNMIIASVTIVFMTFFMLLEGPQWVERLYSLVPERSQPRWRAVGRDVYRAVGGYVTGNLLISLIAGTGATIVLLVMGVPYAVALGLIVAILDLIPLAGATLAGIIIVAVAFLHSVPAGIVVLIYFFIYQQVENQVIQPIVYGRTVQLSPLAVLVSVLVGAQLAGVLGALAAIPVAGTIQVVLVDWQRARRERLVAPANAAPEPPPAGRGVTQPG